MNIIEQRKPSSFTFHDMYCGAGGNAVAAKSLKMEGVVAVNHWPLAVKSHNENHPDIDHDCRDIQAIDPRRYRPANILIISPECTNHSLAKGGRKKKQMDMFVPDPQERSRATMWDVVRFTEHHRYELVLVENVVDVKRWDLYDTWIKAMHALGYDHQEVYLNAMHCLPTPQSRDRWYCMFWKKGNRAPDLAIRPASWCLACSCQVEGRQQWRDTPLGRKRWGKYGPRNQYLYACPTCNSTVQPYHYAGFNCIDWSIEAPMIGERQSHGMPPLKQRTLDRVAYGLERYGRSPLVIGTGYQTGIGYRVRHLGDRVLPTQTGDARQSLVVPPLIVQIAYSHAGHRRVTSSMTALPTQTAQQSAALAIPGPLFLSLNYPDQDAKPAGSALDTVTSTRPFALVDIPPVFFPTLYGTSRAAPATSPLGVVTAGGVNHALVEVSSLRAYLTHHYGNGGATSLIDSLATVASRQHASLVEASSLAVTVEECRFRMLKPHELKRAQAFEDDYVILGTQRQQVKQIGQANPPTTMRVLLQRGLESLER